MHALLKTRLERGKTSKTKTRRRKALLNAQLCPTLLSRANDLKKPSLKAREHHRNKQREIDELFVNWNTTMSDPNFNVNLVAVLWPVMTKAIKVRRTSGHLRVASERQTVTGAVCRVLRIR